MIYFPHEKKNILDYKVTVLVHNVGSHSIPVDYIVTDNKITNSDIIRFTETQISQPDTTCKIIETLNWKQY